MLKMYNYQLTVEENKWLDMFFWLDSPYSFILYRQIKYAKITREYSKYYILINFDVPSSICRLPKFVDRVPIEILVQHTINSQVLGIVYHSFSHDTAMEVQRSADGLEPTSFLLHILQGTVKQLEIYNLDSSAIDQSKVCIGRVDYRISPDFR